MHNDFFCVPLQANDAILRYVIRLSDYKLLSQEDLESPDYFWRYPSSGRGGDDRVADCWYVPLFSSVFQKSLLNLLTTDRTALGWQVIANRKFSSSLRDQGL